MRKNYFEDYEELADYMVDAVQDEEEYYITAALFYEDAANLAKELLRFENVDIEFFEIEPPEYNNYAREYYVTIDNNLGLSVEKAYNSDKDIYLQTDPGMLLLESSVSSAILKRLDKSIDCREIYIGEDSYDDYAETKKEQPKKQEKTWHDSSSITVSIPPSSLTMDLLTTFFE